MGLTFSQSFFRNEPGSEPWSTESIIREQSPASLDPNITQPDVSTYSVVLQPGETAIARFFMDDSYSGGIPIISGNITDEGIIYTQPPQWDGVSDPFGTLERTVVYAGGGTEDLDEGETANGTVTSYQFLYTVDYDTLFANGGSQDLVFTFSASWENANPTGDPDLLDEFSDTDQIILRFNLVCFVSGTLIMTEGGTVPVQELVSGDMVLTRDRGEQPLRWIGRRVVDGEDLRRNTKLRPIRIRQGALGKDSPQTDLLVSPQHRILLVSRIARRMFGQDEILVPACKLLSVDGVEIDYSGDCVEYFHLLFDRHEVILSNGAWTESLLLGEQALLGIGPDYREEISTLFPAVLSEEFSPLSARQIVQSRKRVERLAERHRKNGMYLSSSHSSIDF